MRSLAPVVVIAWALAGCAEPRVVEWSVRGDGIALGPETTFVVVVRDRCGGGAIERSMHVIAASGGTRDIRIASDEPVALDVEAYDGACERIASGCGVVGGDARASIVLAPASGVRRCDLGCACSPIDGGPDEGDAMISIDAGERDASAPTDAGDAGGPTDAGPTCRPERCPGGRCVEGACGYYASCQEIRDAFPTSVEGRYEIVPPGAAAPRDALCHFAGTEGWNVVAVLDGSDPAFAFDAPFWTSTTLVSGDDFTNTLSARKLASWNDVAFTRIRVGLAPTSAGVLRDVTRWVTLDVSAPSMNALFQGGTRSVAISADTWRSLAPGSFLDTTCVRSGISVAGLGLGAADAAVRIGVVGDDDASDCASTNSWIGLGGRPSTLDAPPNCAPTTTTVGNSVACFNARNLEMRGVIEIR